MKLLHAIADLLYPRKCILCGGFLKKQETDLCHKCRMEVPTCSKMRNRIPFIASWTVLWYYEGNVRESLLRFKFHNAQSYAVPYGRMLAMKLTQEQKNFDIIAWVPISQQRKLQRGYDQVELIAEAVGKELGRAPLRALKKLRDNPPQSGIAGQAQRRANVLGVYAAVHPELLQGKRILLLDDIVTTGATISECARVLLSAGAKEVVCAAVACARHQR